MEKHITPWLIIILLITGFMHGCSRPVPEFKAEDSRGGGETAANNVVIWSHMPTYETKMIQQFNEKYPEIKVSLVYVAADEVFSKFATCKAAEGQIPDIVTIEDVYTHEFKALDWFEDLSKAPYHFDAARVLDQLQGLIKDRSGRVVGMPQAPSPMAFAYRRDLANLYLDTDKPEELEKKIDSWDKFLSAARTIREKSRGEVFALASLDWLWNVRYAQNHRPFIQEGRILVRENYLEDFIYLKALWKDKLSLGYTAGTQEEKEAYKNGKAVFFPIASWGIQLHVENYDKFGAGRWGIVSVPGEACMFGGNLFSIPRDAKNKKSAWKYLNWIYGTKEGNTFMFLRTKNLPVLKECYSGEMKKISPLLSGVNLAEFWTEEMKKAETNPLTPYDKQLHKAVSLELRKMTLADITPEEMCGNVEAALKKDLDPIEPIP